MVSVVRNDRRQGASELDDGISGPGFKRTACHFLVGWYAGPDCAGRNLSLHLHTGQYMDANSTDRILELVRSATGGEVAIDDRIELESLEFLELIKDVEDRFHVRIPDDEFLHISTPKDILSILEAQLSARAG
jgi:acyl carrier protein